MKSPLIGKSNVELLYKQNSVPLFQNKVYHSFDDAVASPISDVLLSQCKDTGFVFNSNFDIDRLNYDSNYQNEQSNSSFFQEHLNSIIKLLESNSLTEGKVLEVGCGKGYFMDMLIEKGVDVTGIDPTFEGESEKVIKDYYSEKYSYLEADLIILRHTLEHIPKPLDFVQMIAKSNNYKGWIYIEIPTFEWIVENNAIEDIFYEHCNYFTTKTIGLFFDNVKVEYSFNGQYLSILGDLSSVKKSIEKKDNAERFNLEFYEKQKGYERMLEGEQNIAIWGAGAKGSMFLNLLDKNCKKIKCVIDINTKKQNKFIGGTGHEIIAPEKIEDYKIDKVIVMNKNYYKEIKRSIANPKINIVTL